MLAEALEEAEVAVAGGADDDDNDGSMEAGWTRPHPTGQRVVRRHRNGSPCGGERLWPAVLGR